MYVCMYIGNYRVSSDCNAGGCEFDFGQTNTYGLKITE